jgi:hypothetical protein
MLLEFCRRESRAAICVELLWNDTVVPADLLVGELRTNRLGGCKLDLHFHVNETTGVIDKNATTRVLFLLGLLPFGGQ